MKHGLSGYATLVMPYGVTKERDTFTCLHCQRVRHAEPGGRHFLYPDQNGKLFRCEYTRCAQCDSLICEKCIGKGCTPFEKKLALMERRQMLWDVIMGDGK